MPQITNTEDAEDEVAAMIAEFQAERRRNIALSLDQIAAEVSVALSGAEIDVSVFFTVPSGGSLLTFATPADPDDAIWNRISEIVVQIVSRVAGTDLICQEAACVAASTPMAAADLFADGEPNSQRE